MHLSQRSNSSSFQTHLESDPLIICFFTIRFRSVTLGSQHHISLQSRCSPLILHAQQQPGKLLNYNKSFFFQNLPIVPYLTRCENLHRRYPNVKCIKRYFMPHLLNSAKKTTGKNITSFPPSNVTDITFACV